MKRTMPKPNKAFTLIEIMLVLVIITLVTVVAIYSVSKAQKRGRDSRRKADIATIQGALENYYSQNKVYPTSIPASGDPGYCDATASPGGWTCNFASSPSNSIWIKDLVGYVDNLGIDPVNQKPSAANLSAGYSGGPLKNYTGFNNGYYYGYYTQANATNSCADTACPYYNFCKSGGLAYTAGNYYILAAILENSSDSETIGNTTTPYNIDCNNMKTSGNYNQNAYVKIKAF